jgi:hypothetical protein
MTNIALLPLLQATVNLTTNADWADSLIFTNAAAQYVSAAAVGAPGTGYTNGTQTLTPVGGSGTPALISVTVANGNVVAVNGIAVPGSYALPPAASNAPTSGGGGSGATLNLTLASSPIDLTGISFHCQVRTSAGSSSVVLDMSTTNGLLVSGGTNGILSFAVPAATLQATPAFQAGSYVADVLAQAGSQTVLVAQLTITVTQGVTTP